MIIDFKRANDVLRKEGCTPFPIEEIEIPDESKEKADAAIKGYVEQYEKWMWNEWDKKMA